MVPTDEEIEAYFAEHEEEFANSGVTRDAKLVDIRHILVLPEGATLETIRTETFPEEAWAAGEKQAQEILNEWLSGEQTEDNFAAIANQYSVDPGSNTNGGLYTDVATGDMVEAFDAWCFDANRKVGDYGIVRTELGFHIMYLSAIRPIWKDQVMNDMLSERGSNLIFEVSGKYPMTADYSAITLGYVDLTK
jgi:parvulin-like peptidyl-prolyl isomerase